jgi:hypothetical protein
MRGGSTRTVYISGQASTAFDQDGGDPCRYKPPWLGTIGGKQQTCFPTLD